MLFIPDIYFCHGNASILGDLSLPSSRKDSPIVVGYKRPPKNHLTMRKHLHSHINEPSYRAHVSPVDLQHLSFH